LSEAENGEKFSMSRFPCSGEGVTWTK
jgi:hypothetical protein